MATMGSQGITFGDGSSLRTTPFRFEHIRTAGLNLGTTNRGYVDITTTPDWSLPAKSTCHIYYHIPVRNDTESWGGLYARLLYRINSGSWIDLGDSGYSSVMLANDYSIAYYGCPFTLDFSSQTSDFTLGFLIQGAPYNNTTNVISSNNVGGGSGGESSSNGVLNAQGFYVKLTLTGDAPL